jgi:uncharacterized cupredoxin-like copper-binding protein
MFVRVRRLLPAVRGLALVAASCSGGVEEAEEGGAFLTKKAPADTVTVQLASYTVQPDKATVAAGPVKFVARNTSATEVHELAVLRVRDDGSLQNGGEIEDLKPSTSGEVVLDLPRGKYELACLLVPGEEGSTVDHYKEGMRVAFEVK